MVIFPGAKINIGLRITQKRLDGYHVLQTIYYPVRLFDVLEFVVPDRHLYNDILTISGLVPESKGDNNLVIKVLKLLRERKNIPFLEIHLHKTIPQGAGLGGGSSDASFFMKSLNRYFNLGFDTSELKALSMELGSDCPFFIDNIPVYAEGRGEIMTPVNQLPQGYFLLLIKPDISVRTEDAYKECIPYQDGKFLSEYYNKDIREWKGLIINDFEKTIFEDYPYIANIKDSLYESGAIFSLMSGSGSAVYGIYNKKPEIPQSLRGKVIYSGVL
jgi:4-diphosphocytidyl-2-C-methyl-D-erythritol kinase